MPVPRRRKSKGVVSLLKSPLVVLKVLDVDFLFQRLRTPLLYGFAPGVIALGLLKEPGPASLLELINIW